MTDHTDHTDHTEHATEHYPQTIERLQVTVTQVRFHSPATAKPHTILSGTYKDDSDKVKTVTAHAPNYFHEGNRLVLHGFWKKHAKFGWQFHADVAVHYIPRDTEGLLRFLSSNLVDGVGPKTAARIVHAFGDKTIETIDRDPAALVRIKGVGESRASALTPAIRRERSYMKLIGFLRRHGVNDYSIMRVYAHFEGKAYHALRRDPDKAHSVKHIDPAQADKVAQAFAA